MDLEEQQIALMRLETFYSFEEIASCPETYKMMIRGSYQEIQDKVIPRLELEACIAHTDTREGEWRILQKCSASAFAGSVSGIVAKYIQPKLNIHEVYAEPLKALRNIEKHFKELEQRKNAK